MCSYYIRTPADGGQFYYDRVNVSSPHHDGKMHTPYPPSTGDLIHLWDTVAKKGGTFTVLARQWMHSSYGSTNWPLLEQQPTVGPLLELIVEPVEDVFRYQALRQDDEAEASS
ncbi:hypothetical protein [Streptomyces mirabilis]|uniref:hypothetical protein n=1 Tax=Streptomyces mirabilis TaxID=68239 RepID=UPI0036996E78